MASKIETLVRTVRGLTDDRRFDAFEDPRRLLKFPPARLKTYRTNPYLSDWDQPCQLLGVKDGKVVARRNSFPSRIVADGKVYNTRISGSVWVDPECRSSLYAISLLQQALKFPNGELNINCWMSVQNQKFYKLLKSVMLEFAVFDAGGKWSRYCKRVECSGWKNLAIKVVNYTAALACLIFDRGRYARLPHWTIIETNSPDERLLQNACALIRAEGHPYRQEITPEWIRWTLANDFYAQDCHKAFLAVYDGEAFVGFALARYGSKTKVNKVYEWQLAHSYEDGEASFLALIAKHIYRFGYRTQISVGVCCTTTISELSRRFPRSLGNYAAVTLAADSKFKAFQGIDDPNNWRVRPGMGDACFF